MAFVVKPVVWRYTPSLVVLALSLSVLANPVWLWLKAGLAQHLIAAAWYDAQIIGEVRRPWPWADTYPVARVVKPDGRSQWVLNGVHGRTLPFGPGLLEGSVLPGRSGETVLAGHVDTHFAWVTDLHLGDQVSLEVLYGQQTDYIVMYLDLVDADQPLYWSGVDRGLWLITCSPEDRTQRLRAWAQPKIDAVSQPLASPVWPG